MNKLKLADPSQTLQKPIKVNPKQIQFLNSYYDPKSETVGNIYRSALLAGFSPSYARVLTTNARNLQWLRDAKAYMSRLEVEHIRYGLEEEALHAKSSRDRTRALELLGKAHGMFVDRSITDVNVQFTNSVPRPIIDIPPTPRVTEV